MALVHTFLRHQQPLSIVTRMTISCAVLVVYTLLCVSTCSMDLFPTDDNGVSMSINNVPDFSSVLVALEHGLNIWPDEPELLLQTGRAYFRKARDAARTAAANYKAAADTRAARSRGRAGSDKAGPAQSAGQSSAATEREARLAQRYARKAADRLSYMLRLNPLFPDVYALLAGAFEVLAGDSAVGQRINATFLDFALAAATRALELEPYAAPVCNHIAALIAKGGTVGAFVYDGTGLLHDLRRSSIDTQSNGVHVLRSAQAGRKLPSNAARPSGAGSHAATKSSGEPSKSASVARRLAAAARNDAVHRQLLRCLDIERAVLGSAYSKEFIVATHTELLRTTDALRALSKRQIEQVYWLPPHTANNRDAPGGDGSCGGEEHDAGDIFADGAAAGDAEANSGGRASKHEMWRPGGSSSLLPFLDEVMNEFASRGFSGGGLDVNFQTVYEVVSAMYRRQNGLPDLAAISRGDMTQTVAGGGMNGITSDKGAAAGPPSIE